MPFQKLRLALIGFILFMFCAPLILNTVTYAELNKGKAAVEIISPADQTQVKREEKLPVSVHFNTSYIKAELPNDKEKNYYLKPIQAVELLLDGKSFEVKQLKKPLKEGDATFDVVFFSLPEDATKVKLQAKIYTVYIEPKLPKIKGLKKLAAESKIIAVFFKQIIGPEGGVIQGDGETELKIPFNAFFQPTEVGISSNPFAQLTYPPQESMWFIGSVLLNIGDVDTNIPVDYSIPAPSNVGPGLLDAEDQFLVVEEVYIQNERRIQLVDLADLANNRLESQFVFFPFDFPGIIKSGIYSIFSPFAAKYPENAVGYVKGKVKGQNGNPIPGAVVTISKLPLFVSQTNASGDYIIPSIVGTFAVTAFDPKTGNFNNVNGAVSKGNGVTVDIVLSPSNLPTNTSLTNGGFENGLTGWTTEGSVQTVGNLGNIKPTEGSAMAITSTGEGSIGEASSGLKQSFVIPSGAKTLTFDYNFVSEEFPEFRNSIYNDTFNMTLSSSKKSEQIAFESVNSSTTTPVEGIDFPGGDNTVEMTGWKKKTISLSQFGNPGIITITITDLGDTIYDSVVLLDNFQVITTNGDAALFRFPINGYTAYTAPVSSILDHSSEASYRGDGKVQVFTGEIAQGEKYSNGPEICLYDCVYGYKRNSSGPIDSINYNPPGGKDFLFYDGHPGYDYTFPLGTQIYLAAGGRVQVAGNKCNEVDVFHPNGYITKYYHLNTITVNNGETISDNDIDTKSIGTVGHACLNDENANHLHFETWLNGKVVDPYGWTGAVGASYATSNNLWK